MENIRVAIAGLGFGAEFIPIYQSHPEADCHAICQRNKKRLDEIGDHFGVEKRYDDFEKLLDDKDIDAVHINTPVGDHAWMTLKSLEAGKHTACTVPMGTTVKECRDIIKAEKRSQKIYMMMETAIYTREFLYVKELLDSGKIGKVQFLRGSHQQNMGMPGWPEYWYGFPPMLYSTHAIAPLAELAGADIRSVICHGSGTIEKKYQKKYGSPFSVETAHLGFRDSDITAEVTRSLFDLIRQYRESFDVFGTKMSFEWEQVSGEGPVVFTGLEDAERIEVPDYGHLLPEEIRGFTEGAAHDAGHATFIQGGGHGGSHPHMAHEFITAISENRKPLIDSSKAANWTIAGICAHESALKCGKRIGL